MSQPAASLPTRTTGTARTALPTEGIAARVTARFPRARAVHAYGELTLHVEPGDLVELVTFCRDDEELDCRLLSDLSGVHWPAGDHVIERQTSTTGWPEYRVSREVGMIEVLYVLRSVSRNHWFRVSVGTPDTDPRLPAAPGDAARRHPEAA